MPEGDDELGGHFWWSDAPGICVSMVSEMGLDLWCVDRPNLTSTTTLPLYGTGLCWLLWSVLAKSHITSGGSDRCHSRDGVVPGRTTMPLLWVPGTPLVPAWLIQSRVGARKTYNMWAGYQSSGPLCLVSSGERHWSGTYLGYVIYRESWMTRKFPGSRGSSVLPLQSVNYSNSRVHGQGQLGGAA